MSTNEPDQANQVVDVNELPDPEEENISPEERQERLDARRRAEENNARIQQQQP